MATKILLMGPTQYDAPPEAKTKFANDLQDLLTLRGYTVDVYHASDVRAQLNDTTPIGDGPIKMTKRMQQLADTSDKDFVICNFRCGTQGFRVLFQPNWTIWFDVPDTFETFEKPVAYDFVIDESVTLDHVTMIAECILTNKHQQNFDCRISTVNPLIIAD